ncbi:transcription antitermination factor NusB [Paenibacillus sp. LMG 31458]|jgi:N utilization substance protein B|uniref:Transcription antitermination protein NusB n=2 Tax=Paenibacillus TaxID=44249 RepID=A0ABX1ZCD1_9BACL|nr:MULTISPECIES: transcription antitermination factor NusB [Paenibacillus]MDF2644198.1 nusB [Paenibacillus sp.]KRF12088.1 N utilization substance protein B [Paenibacillus sp. Soil787]MDQ0898199.1 N utilization substance protein B [Paenibacillus sp. V4I7]MDQ0915792.1 N utilization substance protein B [Paenibacillus sp. V4I5]NOU72203.1 transcription antitermination factor NusB [Paenibacillus phytorum]
MKRRVAREIAVQSLYQIQMNEATPQEAVQIAIHEAEHDNETELNFSGDKIDPLYIIELVEGTYSNKVRIDELLEEYLKGWAMDRLSRIDREVLRLAVYEMLYRDDVPPKVVVNEAIDLAKHYGTEESGKFVNGVLGKMIKEVEDLKGKVTPS